MSDLHPEHNFCSPIHTDCLDAISFLIHVAVLEEKIFEEGYPFQHFWPRPGSTPEGIWISNTILVGDLEYIMYTNFHQNPSSGSREEVENVKSLRRTDDDDDDGRRTDGTL